MVVQGASSKTFLFQRWFVHRSLISFCSDTTQSGGLPRLGSSETQRRWGRRLSFAAHEPGGLTLPDLAPDFVPFSG